MSEPLGIVVFDGRFGRVHYALVMASAAAAIGREAILFFTGPAVRALRPQGWRELEGEPGVEEAKLKQAGVAGFGELLDACRELGVRFVACEMGLKAHGVASDVLDPSLGVEVAGMVTLLERAGRGHLLFV